MNERGKNAEGGRRWEEVGAEQLARLLEVAAGEGAEAGGAGWEEGAGILRHQLAAPLLPDLLMVPGAEERRLRVLIEGRTGAGSFGELLTSDSPALELLEVIKQFARVAGEDRGHPLFGEGAKVLYFAAIAAALVRCDMRITKSADAELQEGFVWAARQPGVEELQLILRGAAAKLQGNDGA